MIGLPSIPASADSRPEVRRATPTALSSPLRDAIHGARSALLAQQSLDGHWVGELQGDTILESEYILLLAFLGRHQDEKAQKAARYILSQQLPEGGWSNYPGGPPDLSVSVKAYFALKLTGHDQNSDCLRRAAAVIRSLGGAARCNSFTRFYLALLGQMSYADCPAVPPELLLLPRWLPINIYAFSSWTRTIVVPLTIFYAHKPVQPLPPELGIGELFLEPPASCRPPSIRFFSWANFFLAVDRAFKILEPWGLAAVRRLAVRRAADWMREHFADSDGVGAIFPPMIYTVIALRCLGVADDAPEVHWAMKQLDDLMIEEDGAIRLQPCFSPVWDTALTLIALSDASLSPHRKEVQAGVQWLLDREVRRPGDWRLRLPHVEPSGWFFEYRNGFYPDTDDTAMVLMALARCWPDGGQERALRWLLAMQNGNGGWPAFDRGIENEVLTKIPFADHNAMLDPSCPDITGRVLEALGHYGYRMGHPAVDRGIAFLEKTQEANGSWYGRWGVNYIYGAWQVLQGLAKIGYPPDRPMVRRATAWLQSVQQPGGGWGESCRSYDDQAWAGRGTPTASQTAWALLGLIAAGEADSDAVRSGMKYLIVSQNEDGRWDEGQFTGTGFPRVFYLKYHMYSLYFPLMALARYEKEFGEPPGWSRR